MTANDETALAKLNELRRKSFRDQATWFLNTSSAGESPEKCESVRRIEQKCEAIESNPGDDGERVLDEFQAMRLLEYSNNACSAPELRNWLDGVYDSKRRRVSLAELLIFINGDDWKKLVDSPACSDLIAERRAKDHVDELKTELKRLIDAARDGAKAAEDARQAEKVAIEKEADATKAAEKQRQQELSSRELLAKEKEYLTSLNKLEEKANQRKADLECIISDSSKGVVARQKANAELAILLSQDSSGLRAARMKQETAAKKSSEALVSCKKAVFELESTLHLARAARAEATKRKEMAIAAARVAEEAIPSAQDAFEKASRALDDIQKKSKGGRGTVFFLNADLNEQRRYLPQSQFVIAQKRADEVMHSISSSSSSS